MQTSVLATEGMDDSYSNCNTLEFNALGILQSKNTIRSNAHDYPLQAQ